MRVVRILFGMWIDSTDVLWNWFQAELTSTCGSMEEIACTRSELIASKLALENSQTFHRSGVIEGGDRFKVINMLL